MARPDDTPSVQKRDGTPSPLIFTSIPLFFSNSLPTKLHILTHHHSYTIFVCDSRLLHIAKKKDENMLLSKIHAQAPALHAQAPMIQHSEPIIRKPRLGVPFSSFRRAISRSTPKRPSPNA
ncbi:hypothetical protein PIB30_048807 [Stylosanthes scabra]|uniref:Uncharacterized protein n=1 Tax=Stylosanthes scabra TaxID=79078 RepID=A0ABU6YEJ0_9FABA|nr:hypothetical protein [Stylosanthes scabra]